MNPVEDRWITFENEEYLVIYFDSKIFQLFGPIPTEHGSHAIPMIYQTEGTYAEGKRKATAFLSLKKKKQ